MGCDSPLDLEFLRTEILPQAAQLDRDPLALVQALQSLGRRSLLTLRIDPQWGGQGLGVQDYWQFQRAIARASGALAFLQIQHQSAAQLIAQGQNDALKQQFLRPMARGESRIGVGFSQLRRAGAPLLRAEPENSGYRLNGTIPWATGWQCFEQIVAGAALPDGQALLCLVPFDSVQANQGQIRCSAPMVLVAMANTQTVALTLENWWVTGEQVIDHKPPHWLQQADRKNVLSATAFPLGAARAALDLMETLIAKRGVDELQADWQRLDQAEQNCCRRILIALNDDPNDHHDHSLSFEEKVALRGEAIALAGRCAQGAIAIASGAANGIDHPAQRIYREVLMFTVMGQTEAAMAATVTALAQGY